MEIVDSVLNRHDAAPPMCSVCIANYNGMAFIEACIESVLAQNFEHPVEIIVHDDASTDESVSLIRAKYPSVILIESKENVGFCISNNRMASIAKGKFLLLLNNDAELYSDALQTLLSAANASTRPAILGLPQYDALTNRLIDIGSTFDPFLNPMPNVDTNRTDVGMIIGACLWIPTQMWNEIGGFPTWFGSLAEDMYVCLAARTLGYDVKAVAQSGFRHWVGQSLGGGKVIGNRLSSRISRRKLSERNKNFVMCIFYPSALLWAVFPLHVVLLALEGLAIAALKRSPAIFTSVYLNSIIAIWKMKDILLLERRRYSKTRAISTTSFLQVFSWMPHKLRLLVKHGIPRLS